MPKSINSNLLKLIDRLQDGDYHNGAIIAEEFGLSRNAISKIVKKLVDYDIHIETRKGKGYRLCEPLILLQRKKIKSHLKDKKLKLVVYESVFSTNSVFDCKTTSQPAVCLAEIQTRGKGRLGRYWQSPFGQNIYLSCLYPFQKDLSELAGLSLVISLAMIKTLRTVGLDEGLCVKWPNDIYYHHQKLGGNLIEVCAESHGVCYCVIGIGLNINMQHGISINQPWTSLRKITGQYFDRNAIAVILINSVLEYIETFKKAGFAAFMDEWMQSDCLTDKMISLQLANEKISGMVKGINHQGHLVLALKNGERRAFSSGDASIIKKNGQYL